MRRRRRRRRQRRQVVAAAAAILAMMDLKDRQQRERCDSGSNGDDGEEAACRRERGWQRENRGLVEKKWLVVGGLRFGAWPVWRAACLAGLPVSWDEVGDLSGAGTNSLHPAPRTNHIQTWLESSASSLTQHTICCTFIFLF